jgi:hypothetical protein
MCVGICERCCFGVVMSQMSADHFRLQVSRGSIFPNSWHCSSFPPLRRTSAHLSFSYMRYAFSTSAFFAVLLIGALLTVTINSSCEVPVLFVVNTPRDVDTHTKVTIEVPFYSITFVSIHFHLPERVGTRLCLRICIVPFVELSCNVAFRNGATHFHLLACLHVHMRAECR